MKKSKQKKLEAAGWRVGGAQEFLQMSDEEAALAKLKIALARGVRTRRAQAGLTQQQLAKRIGSSQSRIAKVEAADPTVSAELAIRALFALGTTHKALAKLIGQSEAA
jgi:ribosome-binding protein aMBF1 (putative translation factor)